MTFIFLGWRSVQFLDKLNFHSIISKEHVACEKKMKKLLFVFFFFFFTLEEDDGALFALTTPRERV